MTLRPLGPSVTLTASARTFTPSTILKRVASWNRTCFADIENSRRMSAKLFFELLPNLLTPAFHIQNVNSARRSGSREHSGILPQRQCRHHSTQVLRISASDVPLPGGLSSP